jgi:NAD(P)-dependent dehydrogenase (short-subunit alcohol dehydrogenase family)
MKLELAGRRALVTGGSRGIGRAIARALALEGVDVVIAARGLGGLESTAADLIAQSGRLVVPLAADTSVRAEVDTLVAGAVKALDGLDILVNATGADGVARPGKGDPEDSGYLRTSRAAAPHLVASGWGRIINVGGLLASLRTAGVETLTRRLADELGPKGVHVVAVQPGGPRAERAHARDIADLVVFLASPRSAAVNGSAIAAAGGRY